MPILEFPHLFGQSLVVSTTTFIYISSNILYIISISRHQSTNNVFTI